MLLLWKNSILLDKVCSIKSPKNVRSSVKILLLDVFQPIIKNLFHIENRQVDMYIYMAV